jgi:diphthamide biosynthesis methyltransferase
MSRVSEKIKREAIEAARDADIAELVNASGGLSTTDTQVLYSAHDVGVACIIVVWNYL